MPAKVFGVSPNSPSLWLALRVRCFASQRNRCLTPITSCGARSKWGPARTRLAPQTIAGPGPLEAPLLSAFTRVGGTNSGSDSGQLDLGDATISIAAYARFTAPRGRKHLNNRRTAWFLGSDRNFAAKHPKGALKAWRIWALTSKMPASEFFLLLE